MYKIYSGNVCLKRVYIIFYVCHKPGRIIVRKRVHVNKVDIADIPSSVVLLWLKCHPNRILNLDFKAPGLK